MAEGSRKTKLPVIACPDDRPLKRQDKTQGHGDRPRWGSRAWALPSWPAWGGRGFPEEAALEEELEERVRAQAAVWAAKPVRRLVPPSPTGASSLSPMCSWERQATFPESTAQWGGLRSHPALPSSDLGQPPLSRPRLPLPCPGTAVWGAQRGCWGELGSALLGPTCVSSTHYCAPTCARHTFPGSRAGDGAPLKERAREGLNREVET